MPRSTNAPIALLTAFLACSCSQPAPLAQAQPSAPPVGQPPKWGMVIHTGAGNFTLSGIAERKDAMQAGMEDGLVSGFPVLGGGGGQVDPVPAARGVVLGPHLVHSVHDDPVCHVVAD